MLEELLELFYGATFNEPIPASAPWALNHGVLGGGRWLRTLQKSGMLGSQSKSEIYIVLITGPI